MSMKRTLKEQIESNKRSSGILVAVMMLLITAIATCIVGISAPKVWFIGIPIGAILSIGAAVVARFQGTKIVLSISGARLATDIEHRVLNNVVEEMAIASGLPVPQIYVIDDPAPNAFATGQDPQHGIVAITSGLLEQLDRDELQGVMAHEMGHIRNYDIRYMTMVTILAGTITLLADYFRNMIWWGVRSRDRDNGPLTLIFFVVGLVLSIISPIAAVLLSLAVSRQREFLADASAAEMTRYPEGLANALQKISGYGQKMEGANRAMQHMYIVNPLKLQGGSSDLFSTHPSTEERVRALMNLTGTYETQRRIAAAQAKAVKAPPTNQISH